MARGGFITIKGAYFESLICIVKWFLNGFHDNNLHKKIYVFVSKISP